MRESPSVQGARRAASGGVLAQYVEHGEQAQRSNEGLLRASAVRWREKRAGFVIGPQRLLWRIPLLSSQGAIPARGLTTATKTHRVFDIVQAAGAVRKAERLSGNMVPYVKPYPVAFA